MNNDYDIEPMEINGNVFSQDIDDDTSIMNEYIGDNDEEAEELFDY